MKTRHAEGQLQKKSRDELGLIVLAQKNSFTAQWVVKFASLIKIHISLYLEHRTHIFCSV